MSDASLLRELIDDAEETLWAEGMLMLYDISWRLNAVAPGLAQPRRQSLMAGVYAKIRADHDLVQVLVNWPARAVVRLAEDVAPDFELEPEGPIDTLILTLIPAEDLASPHPPPAGP